MKRWMILLNRLARLTITASRRSNHEYDYACLYSMFARTRRALKRNARCLVDRCKTGSQTIQQPTRVEILEPRLLFSASVAGHVFGDLDYDGLQDRQDPMLSDWTVYHDANFNGEHDKSEQSVVTESDGSFALTGLSAGIQRIGFVAPQGFTTSVETEFERHIALDEDAKVENYQFAATIEAPTVSATFLDAHGSTISLNLLESDELADGLWRINWGDGSGTSVGEKRAFSHAISPETQLTISLEQFKDGHWYTRPVAYVNTSESLGRTASISSNSGERVTLDQGTLQTVNVLGETEVIELSNDVSAKTLSLTSPLGGLGGTLAFGSTGLPFSDDFSDGNANDWTTNGGTWSVVNGELEQTGSVNPATAYWDDIDAFSWSDYAFQANVRSSDVDTVSLLFGYQDDNNHYRFEMNGSSGWMSLVKIDQGNWHGLASLNGIDYAYEQNRDYLVRVEYVSGGIKVLVDGEDLFGTIADSTHTQGTVGFKTFWNNGSYFDDVVVVASADNVAPVLSTNASVTVTDDLGGTLALSVGVTDVNPDTPMRYTWEVLSKPADASVWLDAANGTEAAGTLAATVDRPGAYSFQVTATDPWGVAITDTVAITTNSSRVYPLSLADISVDLDETNGVEIGFEEHLRIENNAGHYESWMKFDVSSLTDATSVSLALKVADTSASLTGLSLQLDHVANTFTNQLLGYDGTYAPTVISSIGTYGLSALSIGDVFTISDAALLAAVQAAIAGDGVLALRLSAPTASPDAWIEFGSRENSDSTYIPRLEADQVTTPLIEIAGPATIDAAGGIHDFTFSVPFKPTGDLTWHIGWGDGQSEVVTTTSLSTIVSHDYAAGTNALTVEAYAFDASGRRYAGEDLFQDTFDQIAPTKLSYWRFNDLPNSTEAVDYGELNNSATLIAADARNSSINPLLPPDPTQSGWVYRDADTSVDTHPGILEAQGLDEYETTSGSISLFFNDTHSLRDTVILGKARDIDGNRMRIWTVPTGGSSSDHGALMVTLGPDDTPIIQTANDQIWIDEWNHLVMTWEPSGSDSLIKLYLNGELVGTGTSPLSGGMADVSGQWQFGVRHHSSTSKNHHVFSGTLDEVAVLDTVLSATQVSELWEAESTATTF